MEEDAVKASTIEKNECARARKSDAAYFIVVAQCTFCDIIGSTYRFSTLSEQYKYISVNSWLNVEIYFLWLLCQYCILMVKALLCAVLSPT